MGICGWSFFSGSFIRSMDILTAVDVRLYSRQVFLLMDI
jgi:hypothetical protein